MQRCAHVLNRARTDLAAAQRQPSALRIHPACVRHDGDILGMSLLPAACGAGSAGSEMRLGQAGWHPRRKCARCLSRVARLP